MLGVGGAEKAVPELPAGPFQEGMNWGKAKQLIFGINKYAEEARAILGITEEFPDEKVVRDAHRKLMVLNHPDAGGSTYIAIKLNEAKSILLKEKESSEQQQQK